MSNERQISVGTGLTTTDNGANSTFVIGLGPVLSYFNGTGATTQQSAANAILNFSSLASQDICYYNGTNWVRLAKGANNTFLGINGSGLLAYGSPAGSGTVTSVGMTVPSWLTVTGNPITGSGTLAVAATSGLAANQVLATPDSVTGAVSLRALVANDIPNHSAAKITSGNLAKAQHATSAVFNDQSNTYSGTFTQDHGGSGQTLVIPKKTIGATNGEIAIDTDDLKFVNTSGTARTVVKTTRTVSAGTGLTGGGDLSADRTISLSSPVVYTNGGTGLTTAATGTILVGNGSGYTAVGPGTSGQVVISNGTTLAMGSVPTFGGTGSDGAVTKGAVTETTVMQYNATTLTQTVSTTYGTEPGSIYRSTSTQDWNGTTNVAASSTTSAGSAGTSGPDGTGTVPGRGSVYGGSAFTATGGGGGGGNAGAGARGADGGAAGAVGGGSQKTYVLGGSSGGTAAGTGAAGGTGGSGGGTFYAESVGNFTIGASGSINANGSAGGTGGTTSSDSGGGGGGAGGTVQVLCQATLTKTGSISAAGGNGGSAGGASGGKGGPGGGGRIVVMAPTITGAGSLTVSAGSNAATGSTTNLGTASAGVATSITGTPTIRFAMDMRKNWTPLDTNYHLACDAGVIKPGDELKCEAKSVIQMYAAFNSRNQREQAKLAHEYTFGAALDGVCQAEWLETTCGGEVLHNAV
ncbi:MAG: hypothetical protein JSS82_15520 [Bacteroidetes bacterium]|nr:hypothetical protein [Bacteroidota bacterium]